jgi:hypothetical protein
VRVVQSHRSLCIADHVTKLNYNKLQNKRTTKRKYTTKENINKQKTHQTINEINKNKNKSINYLL